MSTFDLKNSTYVELRNVTSHRTL